MKRALAAVALAAVTAAGCSTAHAPARRTTRPAPSTTHSSSSFHYTPVGTGSGPDIGQPSTARQKFLAAVSPAWRRAGDYPSDAQMLGLGRDACNLFSDGWSAGRIYADLDTSGVHAATRTTILAAGHFLCPSIADLSGLGGSPRTRIVAWHRRVKPQMDALLREVTDMERAAGAANVASLTDACVRLRGTVDTLLRPANRPPSVPGGFDQSWTLALTSYQTASRACIAGDYGVSSRAIHTATQALTLARQELPR